MWLMGKGRGVVDGMGFIMVGEGVVKGYDGSEGVWWM